MPGDRGSSGETPAGWVVYTGDLRQDGDSKWRTERFAEAAPALKPAVLITEGTRVGATASTTEPDVKAAAEEVVAKAEGVVIADFTASTSSSARRSLGSSS